MNTKQKEQLSTQENVENNHNKNSPLIEREKIEGTPFTLIKYEDIYFAVMGDHKITENCPTKTDTLKWIKKNTWLIIINMIAIAVEKLGVENDNYKNWKKQNLQNENNVPQTESL